MKRSFLWQHCLWLSSTAAAAAKIVAVNKKSKNCSSSSTSRSISFAARQKNHASWLYFTTSIVQQYILYWFKSRKLTRFLRWVHMSQQRQGVKSSALYGHFSDLLLHKTTTFISRLGACTAGFHLDARLEIAALVCYPFWSEHSSQLCLKFACHT